MFDCGSLVEAGANGAILFDGAIAMVGPAFMGLFAFAGLVFLVRSLF